MKNIHIIEHEKYKDNLKFEKVSNGVYKSLYDYNEGLVQKGHYVTTLSFTLEPELNEVQDKQYPLEDILDKYFAHVSDFVLYDDTSTEMILELCTQDWLNKMEDLLTIVGKRVYNKEVEEDGKNFIKLEIE
ncbi:hypothetical protein [Soonwooa sp.]|uniref:hypothetical protein n=1 Tax=Soonwooa sp. TaxID=1938592 RepID=UPI002614112F|nr:hypothetical protein [Soonwooa sp.]